MGDLRDQWVDAVLSMKNPPQAISTSYADHEQTGTYLTLSQAHISTHNSVNPYSSYLVCETSLQQLRAAWFVKKFSYFPAGRGRGFGFSLQC